MLSWGDARETRATPSRVETTRRSRLHASTGRRSARSSITPATVTATATRSTVTVTDGAATDTVTNQGRSSFTLATVDMAPVTSAQPSWTVATGRVTATEATPGRGRLLARLTAGLRRLRPAAAPATAG